MGRLKPNVPSYTLQTGAFLVLGGETENDIQKDRQQTAAGEYYQGLSSSRNLHQKRRQPWRFSLGYFARESQSPRDDRLSGGSVAASRTDVSWNILRNVHVCIKIATIIKFKGQASGTRAHQNQTEVPTRVGTFDVC